MKISKSQGLGGCHGKRTPSLLAGVQGFGAELTFSKSTPYMPVHLHGLLKVVSLSAKETCQRRKSKLRLHPKGFAALAPSASLRRYHSFVCFDLVGFREVKWFLILTRVFVRYEHDYRYMYQYERGENLHVNRPTRTQKAQTPIQ